MSLDEAVAKLDVCVRSGKALVVGTTGYAASSKAIERAAVRTCRSSPDAMTTTRSDTSVAEAARLIVLA